MKSNLDQVVYKKFSTSEERANILQKCEEISDWLENQLEYNDNADNLQNMALIRKKGDKFGNVFNTFSRCSQDFFWGRMVSSETNLGTFLTHLAVAAKTFFEVELVPVTLDSIGKRETTTKLSKR